MTSKKSFCFNARAVFSFVALSVLSYAPQATAFSFTPSSLQILVDESQPSRTFTVENPGDSKLAVQISVHRRIIDENGAEQLPETNDFSLYPKQAVLGPRQKKAVRISYTGSKKLDRESAYRVVAEQMPVDLMSIKPAEGMNLKFLIKYQTSVYVKPGGASSRIRVESISRVDEKGKPPQMAMVFVNDGTAHQILEKVKLKLKARDAAETAPARVLEGEDIRALEAINILAGGKRRVLLPWPKDLASGTYNATVDIN